MNESRQNDKNVINLQNFDITVPNHSRQGQRVKYSWGPVPGTL